jgi:soluble lytic murein transglycosylase
MMILFLTLSCPADKVDRNFSTATQYRLDERYEKALPLYEKVAASSKEPIAEHALYHVGEILAKLGRWDDSAAAFERYLKGYPNGIRRKDALLGLGESYLNAGRFDKVVQVYSKLLNQRIKPDLALLRIGRGYEGLGDFRKAIIYYRRVMERYPSTLYARSAVSRLNKLASMGKFRPTRKEVLSQGIALYRSGEYRGARRKFARIKLRKGDSISTQAIYYTGLSYMGERRYKSAISTFNKLLRSYPYTGYVTSTEFRIAQCYRRRGRKKEAERRFLDFAKRFPWSKWADDALYEAGRIQMEEGRYPRAATTFWRVATKYGTGRFTDDALWFAGWCRYKQEKHIQALEPFREILRSHPRSRYADAARYWMARIYERIGNRASALYHYRKLASSNNWYYGVKARERLRSLGVKLKGDSRVGRTIGGKDLTPFPRAHKLISLGAFDDGAQELIAILRKSRRQRVRIYYNLSLCYRRLNSHPQAIKYGIYLRNLLGDHPEVLKLAYPLPYREAIEKAAAEFKLDPSFVAAMVYEESKFNPEVVSPAGAIGLMQIIPSTGKEIAKKLGVKQFSPSRLFEPELNIRFGCYYMRQLMEMFDGNLVLVAGAYNSGPGRINGWVKRFKTEDIDEFVEDMPYPETRRHVKKVIATYEIYRSIYRTAGKRRE